MLSAHRLAARGESPAAFDRRCIPPGAALGVVYDGSNTPGILPPPALRGERLDGLGATPGFHHGLPGRDAGQGEEQAEDDRRQRAHRTKQTTPPAAAQGSFPGT